ncbi:MAG: DUF268 domain-containing protein [Patescibacteria group bacterium]
MSFNLRQSLKKVAPLKVTVVCLRALKNKYSFATKLRLLSRFLSEYRAFQKLPINPRFIQKTEDIYPRIYDNTTNHHLDPVYFFQGCWCAKKIFEQKPSHHYDIGSQASMVGIISQFTPTTMVDIRPIPLSLSGLFFVKGSILELPFKDGEIASLSSICVIEHIGLGRYGDPLDTLGSEKALKELVRVLAPGGSLYLTVPVDSESKVYFNAHRAFTREYLLELAAGLVVVEEKYIYGDSMYETYDRARGFGTGLYHFKKSPKHV